MQYYDQPLVCFAARHIRNCPSCKAGLTTGPWTLGIIMDIVTAVYGGLHTLCRHSHFLTGRERSLWRVSSLITAGGPLAISAITGGLIGYVWFQALFDRMKIPSRGRDTITIAAGVLFTVMFVLGGNAYVDARLFILMETFISLRSLPSGADRTPNWTPLSLYL